jgi:hypothetical protein
MTLAVILVVVAALSLVLILRVAVSRRLQIPRGLTQPIQPLDLQAFRNLVDPAEDDYLRRRLPASEFRKVRRERLRATAAYVRTAGRNAAILTRIGQTALTAGDPHTADAARQLVDDALLLRRNATSALFKIYIVRLWPNSGWFAAPIVRGYEQLNGSAMLLGRLQNPASPVRISATW